jgi:hypothetical protein
MTTTPPADAEARPPVDWARAAEGIQLSGLAVFLLLNTTGALPWSFWFDALALWPVLVMSAGLKMAVDRTRAPWLQLLGPALVLSSLSWLALSQRPITPVRDWKPLQVSRPEGVERLELTGGLFGTSVRASVQTLPEAVLAEGRMASRRERARLDEGRDGTTATLRLRGGERGGVVFLPGAQDHWELRLSDALPLGVELGGVMSRVVLDLGGARLERGKVEGVFLGTELNFGRPERDTEVQVNGVFNAVTVSVPPGVPVRVRGAGLPFNLVDRGTGGNGPGYEVKLGGVFSAVSVHVRREPEPAPAPSPSSARPPAEAPPAPAR